MERITSRQNPLLVQVRKLLRSRSERREQGLFVGDGVKLLAEAIRWKVPLSAVILSDGVSVCGIPESVRCVTVPRDVMDWLSDMEAPQGALFVAKLPQPTTFTGWNRCLILDGVQDPGNVGAILRTADAMDIPVVLSDGCADAYNAKTVRASMGAVFRSPPYFANEDTVLMQCRSAGIPIYCTALTDTAVTIEQAPLRGAVVLGSEGSGVSEKFLSACDGTVIIPMNARCESLNVAVAAGIVLWEMCHRREDR